MSARDLEGEQVERGEEERVHRPESPAHREGDGEVVVEAQGGGFDDGSEEGGGGADQVLGREVRDLRRNGHDEECAHEEGGASLDALGQEPVASEPAADEGGAGIRDDEDRKRRDDDDLRKEDDQDRRREEDVGGAGEAAPFVVLLVVAEEEAEEPGVEPTDGGDEEPRRVGDGEENRQGDQDSQGRLFRDERIDDGDQE